jgi:hypothetical protein
MSKAACSLLVLTAALATAAKHPQGDLRLSGLDVLYVEGNSEAAASVRRELLKRQSKYEKQACFHLSNKISASTSFAKVGPPTEVVGWAHQPRDRAVLSPTSAASNLTHRRLYSMSSHIGTFLLHFDLINQLPDGSSQSRITRGRGPRECLSETPTLPKPQ